MNVQMARSTIKAEKRRQQTGRAPPRGFRAARERAGMKQIELPAGQSSTTAPEAATQCWCCFMG